MRTATDEEIVEPIEITPIEEFFILTSGSSLEIDMNSWSLSVEGLVECPLRLTYEDLLKEEMISEPLTLECIINPVGGRLIGTAKWTGVRLRDILQRAKPKSGVGEIISHCLDGFSHSLPIERAFRQDILLALRMNGGTLPKDYGFPVRLVNPGKYGFQWPKWIVRIEATDREYGKAHWKEAEVDWEPDVKLTSFVRQPVKGERVSGRRYRIEGMSFAGKCAVGKVEVSTDGGNSWDEGELRTASLPYVWTRWTYDWVLPAPGEYEIVVHGVDDRGYLQASRSASAYPDGVSGWHRVCVEVVAPE